MNKKELQDMFELARKRDEHILMYIDIEDYEALEMIIVDNKNFDKKLDYIDNAYDEGLKLKSNEDIQILDLDLVTHVGLMEFIVNGMS
mgnify:CR=1 FL=1